MVTKPTILVPPSLSNSSCHHPRYQNVSIWSTISTGDVVQTAVVLALTFAILFANILLISVINSRRYAKYIHSQPRYLLTSLACNDLAMGLCVTPFAILSSIRNCWPYAEIVCQVQALLRGAISQQSAVILICMAMDRYYCMLHPVEYHKHSSRKAWFIIIISITWVGSMALFSILVIKQGGFYFNSTGMHACEPFYPKASLRILSACGFYFPTTMILMYCYGSAFDVNKLGFKRSNLPCSISSNEVQQSSSMEKLEEALADCSTFGKPPAFKIFQEKMNLLAKLHLSYVTGGALLYFIFFAPMHKKNCEALNIQRNFSEICALLIPIHIPLVPYAALEKFPFLQLINAAEFLMLMYIYVVCGTVVWLNVEVIEYICLRIRHLKTVLLEALACPNRATRRGLFGRAVQYHEEILRMGRLADEFFGTELVLHVVLTGAILGVSAFVMLESATLETLMIFVGWLNAIIMGCAAGQRLINESATISDVLHEVDWFEFDNGLKKDLLFFLVRSRKSMYIRAGNVIMANELIIQLIDHERKLSLICSRTMAAMSLGFIVLVTPWTIQEVVAACTGSRAPPALDFIATWMALSNSFWYPFIYWTLNNHFRRICREIFNGVFCRKIHDKKQQQFDHFCNTSPSSKYIGHTPDCDLEGLSEKYWGEILERTVSSSSIPEPQQSNSLETRLDCNGIELSVLNNSPADL
ncbi:hypothetical protein HUJ04_011969 [Dendroctonus ponderosae]|nr:hypothetical protein HUJ04_011969 [Dendroctonus ponderosae]